MYEIVIPKISLLLFKSNMTIQHGTLFISHSLIPFAFAILALDGWRLRDLDMSKVKVHGMQ